MYLYDYQRTTLNKIRFRGRSFIIHGPRRIGMDIMIANHVLVSASDMYESTIAVICPRQDIATEFCTRKLPIALFDAKQVGYSMFDYTLDITQNERGRITLSNGSVIKAISAGSFGSIGCNLNWLKEAEIAVIDSSNMIPNMDEVLAELARCGVSTIIVTLTGSMDVVTHKLYVDSIRGKNDFEYIRIPIDVLPKPSYNKMIQMKDTVSEEVWNKDMEMVPNVERELIP
jgi:hypothetical protein